MIGTSIQDLSKNNIRQENINSSYNEQHNSYFNNMNYNHHHQLQPQLQHQPQPQLQFEFQNKDSIDMEELTKELNNNLIDDKSMFLDNEDDQNYSEKYFSYIPQILREPLIILILFIILSQPMVKDTIGKYIKQIVPDDEGKVSFAGIVIYGAILSSLFLLIKQYFL